ncbi:sensor histidine kinase [Microbulbifer agarilyticus]
MKSHRSLRLYFIGTITLLAVSMAMFMTTTSLNSTVQGIDSIIRRAMLDAARETRAADQPHQVLFMNVARDWQDIPETIRQYLPEAPQGEYRITKTRLRGEQLGMPRALFFAIRAPDAEGQPVYVAARIVPSELVNDKQGFINPVLGILLPAIISILAFITLLWLVVRAINRHSEALVDWARALNRDTLKQPPPNFTYRELNSLAAIVQNSLRSVQESLDREQEFLRNASHELRTPIAVVRSSAELLSRSGSGLHSSEAAQRAVARLTRASQTMSHLTETLLWLGREGEPMPPATQVRLDQLVQQLLDDHHYLLAGKDVNIQCSTEACEVALPATPCRIVLSNLIRNAFQHTQAGHIEVIQSGSHVYIANFNRGDAASGEDALGFGLGTRLASQLIERFAWTFVREVREDGYTVELDFGKPEPEKLSSTREDNSS